MLKYYKLFDMLNRRGMKKTDLLQVVSAPVLAKLGKGAVVRSDSITRICAFMSCQPGDIVEYISDDKAVQEND